MGVVVVFTTISNHSFKSKCRCYFESEKYDCFDWMGFVKHQFIVIILWKCLSSLSVWCCFVNSLCDLNAFHVFLLGTLHVLVVLHIYLIHIHQLTSFFINKSCFFKSSFYSTQVKTNNYPFKCQEFNILSEEESLLSFTAPKQIFTTKIHSSWSTPGFVGVISLPPPELSSQHPLPFHLCTHLSEHQKESRIFSSQCTPVGLSSVRCAMWNQHPLHLTLGEGFECGTATSACRLCIVSSSDSSLCSCGSHFSLSLSALFQTSLHIAPADKAPERPAR